MDKPFVVITPFEGAHNRQMRRTQERLREGHQYKDLSTICVIPTRGEISAPVVESWMSLMPAMNNKYIRIFVGGMGVADAYNIAIQNILDHPVLSKWKYVLTLEEDNMPPQDGLLKLYEHICDCKKLCTEHYAQVAGLYFTKGEGGQPMIYGDPRGITTFEPQVPKINTVQECNGTGMGFTLFHLDLFKEKKISKPWFRTIEEVGPSGAMMGTQDLYFMNNVRKAGYKIASDNRVRVGHYDHETGIVW